MRKGFRLLPASLNHGIGPDRVIQTISITGIADDQLQPLHAGEIDPGFLGRLPAADRAGFPQNLAIADEFEVHRATLGGIVDSDPRMEALGRAVQVDRIGTRRVCAKAAFKLPPGERKGLLCHRLPRLRGTPEGLGHGAEIEVVNRDGVWPGRPGQRRQEQAEQDRHVLFFHSHLARYPEACFGFAGEGTASPWSEAFPEVLYLLVHRL